MNYSMYIEYITTYYELYTLCCYRVQHVMATQ